MKNRDKFTVDWEEISEEMKKHKVLKSAKQCRERWMH